MAKSAELEKSTETGHEHDRIEVRSVCADCGKGVPYVDPFK